MKYQTQPDYVFEIPPVKNYFLYAWRIFGKIFAFFIFGLGGLLLGIFALPVMKLIWQKKEVFNKKARRLVTALFRFFTAVLSVFSVAKITINDKKKLNNLGGCVVVANHPSLLDVVTLISQIPNANCIVNASLKKNVIGAVVASLYITNDYEHAKLIELCKQTIAEGNALIIFPEGTRSKPQGQNQYKKGAARVALAAKCPIVPVFIGGNDKIGLRKKDPILLFNHTDYYRYSLCVKEEISPDDFKELPEPAAAKRITEKIHDLLCYENNKEYLTGINKVYFE